MIILVFYFCFEKHCDGSCLFPTFSSLQNWTTPNLELHW